MIRFHFLPVALRDNKFHLDSAIDVDLYKSISKDFIMNGPLMQSSQMLEQVWSIYPVHFLL